MTTLSDRMQFARDIGFNAPAELATWDFGKLGWEDDDILR